MNAPTPSDVLRRRMREIRDRRGMSQRDLERELKKLGVPISQSAIALIETGQPSRPGQKTPRKVSLDEAVAIAAALDVPLDDIYREPLDRKTYEAVEYARVEEPGISPDLAWLRIWAKQRRREQSTQKEKQ